ncbi:MAG: nitroreductase [Planctomycetaceae bacterium]|nr:nitroreductase [Planctomycetaceae bacterium]
MNDDPFLPSEPSQKNPPLPLTIEELLQERRSIRGFTQQPVPEEILRRIFELGQLSPSNCNVQPWRTFVASGAAKDRLRAALTTQVRNHIPGNPDYPYNDRFEEPYRGHQVRCAIALFKEMGIERDDKEGRARANMRNYEFFDAPHVAFIGMHRQFREPVAIDIGIYLQSLMLAMTAYGIGCCAQGSLRNYPDIVRQEFGISRDIAILVGLSFGYEDTNVIANRVRMPRTPIEENVVFRD